MTMKTIITKATACCMLMLAAMLTMTSCNKEDDPVYTIYVHIQLPDNAPTTEYPAMEIVMKDASQKEFKATTDYTGTAKFMLAGGLYDASASYVTEDEYDKFIYAGNKSGINVNANDDVELDITVTQQQLKNPIVISEIYCGGCQKDDGSGAFAMDKYIILHNNSVNKVSIKNLCIGMASPYNAEATNLWMQDGVLSYEKEDYIPAINGIWYFPNELTFEGSQDIVIAVNGAIDHTQTYSNSVNLARSSFYCMYDPQNESSTGTYHYNNTSYYPAPADVIPTSHYLKAYQYGTANAWPLSQTSPALFIFQTDGAPADYAAANIIYPAGNDGKAAQACIKVLRSMVLDAVEVYNADKLSSCKKRLTSDLDNGYVSFTSKQGHVVCRKYDNMATYHLQDTNNSSDDFQEVKVPSID